VQRCRPAAYLTVSAAIFLPLPSVVTIPTRHPAPGNGRLTLVRLTDAGYAKVVASAPVHVETVRRLVIDPLTKQLNQRVSETILAQLIPTGERPPWWDRTRE
jgi:hypothetical protein